MYLMLSSSVCRWARPIAREGHDELSSFLFSFCGFALFSSLQLQICFRRLLMLVKEAG